ncbi:hypothetical protein GN958_ATG13607, partial [Phytophthora infestans]
MAITRAQERDEFIEVCIRPEQTDRTLGRDGNTIEALRFKEITILLRLNNSRLEQHLIGVTQSANMALDVVSESTADYKKLQRDGERYAENIIEAFLRDISPPTRSTMIGPLLRIKNVEDTEY